jgi:predicted DNA-binding transcriptional regulator YafY
MKAATRPPVERLVVIDQLIRAGRYPNAHTVAKQLEVDPRTARRDFGFLRDRCRAPLEYSTAHHGYFYRDQTYALPLMQLTEGELIAVFVASRLLPLYRGTPFEEDLRRAFNKITVGLPAGVTVDLNTAAQCLSITPAAVPLQDVEKFRVLCTGVLRRHRLHLEYWTASRDELTERGVDPYHLTQIEGNWFLIGYCHLRHEIRMFSAVRVRSVRDTGEEFARPSDFQIEEYMNGSFRALRGQGHYSVLLRFAAEVAGRVKEKQWHASQKTEPAPDGGLFVRLEVTDLREVLRWALWWGADCEVVEPAEFGEMIRQEVELMAEKY